MPSCNRLVCFQSSWIKTTSSGLSDELGVNVEKKINGNWDIINKNVFTLVKLEILIV